MAGVMLMVSGCVSTQSIAPSVTPPVPSASSAVSIASTGLSYDATVSGTTRDGGYSLTVAVRVSNPKIVVTTPNPGSGTVVMSIVGDVNASYTNTGPGKDYTPSSTDGLWTYYVYPSIGPICREMLLPTEGTFVYVGRDDAYCLLSSAAVFPYVGLHQLVIRPGETTTWSQTAATFVSVKVPRDSVDLWRDALSRPVFAIASLDLSSLQLFSRSEDECPVLRIVPLTGGRGVCQVLEG